MIEIKSKIGNMRKWLKYLRVRGRKLIGLLELWKDEMQI
jgi:hypothetical protein